MSHLTDDYYTVDQFAAIHGVHRKTVYRWVRRGVAPKHEVLGRMIWIEKKDAAGWKLRDERCRGDKKSMRGRKNLL